MLFIVLNLDPVPHYFRLLFIMKKCNNEIVKRIKKSQLIGHSCKKGVELLRNHKMNRNI